MDEGIPLDLVANAVNNLVEDLINLDSDAILVFTDLE